MTETTLPVPDLAEHELRTRAGGTEVIQARLLGEASSYAPGKQRWLDVKILRAPDDAYLVHTVGHTLFDDEVTRVRTVRTVSPYEVVELLTTTHKGTTYLPRDAARALAQAAAYDGGLREAYQHRRIA